MEMTIDEAISWLESFIWHEGEDVTIYDTDIEAIHMAIKALKQKFALDKIRAEIQENINYNKKMDYKGIVAGLLVALDIIDKYKAKNEG